MEESVGKIIWGYFWRLIAWSFLISFVIGFIAGLILGVSNVDSMSLSSMISMYRKQLIVTLIISLIGTVLACKFATSGIQKKFVINEGNVKAIFKGIVIILVALTIFYVVYNIGNINKINEAVEDAKSLDISIVEDFVGFCKTFSIIAIISNVVVMLLMIPFEKKLLKA